MIRSLRIDRTNLVGKEFVGRTETVTPDRALFNLMIETDNTV